MEFDEKKRIKVIKLKEKKKTGLFIVNINLKLLIKKEMKKKLLSDCELKKIYMNYFYINIINKNNFNNKFMLISHSEYYLNFRVLFYLLILYVFNFLNHSSVVCLFNKSNLLYKSSEITLKTKGTGSIKRLSNNGFLLAGQCKVYLNDIYQNGYNIEYTINSNDNDNINTFKIICDVKMETAICMFSGCDKIIEIDLSKFDSSDVVL